MIFTVPNLTKERRAELVEKVESWKNDMRLSMPNIKGYTPKGSKLEIEFHDSDSVKVVALLRKSGYDFE